MSYLLSYVVSFIVLCSELVLQAQLILGNSVSQVKRLKAPHHQHVLLLSDCLCLVRHSLGLIIHILE